MDSPNMNSQDQDMYFTNLLSQDSPLGEQSGNSPETFDDSPSLTPNNTNGGKKSAWGMNFTPEEDKLLVSAWLNSSLDAVQGTDQKHSQFWEKVFEYFQQYKETTTGRTIKSLIQRWSFIQKATNKFCSKLAQVEGLNPSGMTEQDKFEKAKTMYQSLEKCSFQFEHCWHLLKDQPKWISRARKDDINKRRTIFTPPNPTRCSTPIDDSVLDLETGNVNKNVVIELDRPMGRKVEKQKRKAQGNQAEEIVQIRKMKYTLLEESRAQEKEFYRLKAQKMEYDKEKEEKRLHLEERKLELANKESDQRIMMMDVSVMPEMQRLYFEELQREIIMRRGHASHKQL